MAACSSALAALLAVQCGVVTFSQAAALLGRAAVRWQVQSGRWQRAARGVFVAHSGPITGEQRLWVDVLRSVRDAVLAGVTAASLEGLRGYDEERTHIALPPGQRVAGTRGLALHRSVHLGPGDVHPTRRPRRTRLARSLVDAARWSDGPRHACALLIAGVQQRLVRPADMRSALLRTPTARWRQLLLQTVDDAAGGAHSLSELDLVQLCRRFRLPEPHQQVPRRDRHGRRRWLDAYWPEWRLHVEVDGAAHQEVASWWDDMTRQKRTVDAW
jgi:hypothetical protein